jgi:hypothetical protein
MEDIAALREQYQELLERLPCRARIPPPTAGLAVQRQTASRATCTTALARI